jgi:uncharacterized protein YkwD
MQRINTARAALGRSPLSLNEDLVEAATVRVREIVTFFSYDRPDGRKGWTAIDDAGYNGRIETIVSYNIQSQIRNATYAEIFEMNCMNNAEVYEYLMSPRVADIGFAFLPNPSNPANTYMAMFIPIKPEYKAPLNKANEINEVLRLVNALRVKMGARPVSLKPQLNAVADIRAREVMDLQEHERPDGTMCFTALDEVGYPDCNAGENIAWGQSSALEVYTDWFNSTEGHYENMIRADWRYLGIGFYENQNSRYGYYWAQMFTDR